MAMEAETTATTDRPRSGSHVGRTTTEDIRPTTATTTKDEQPETATTTEEQSAKTTEALTTTTADRPRHGSRAWRTITEDERLTTGRRRRRRRRQRWRRRRRTTYDSDMGHNVEVRRGRRWPTNGGRERASRIHKRWRNGGGLGDQDRPTVDPKPQQRTGRRQTVCLDVQPM